MGVLAVLVWFVGLLVAMWWLERRDGAHEEAP